MRTIHTEKYYDTTPHMVDVYNRNARSMGFCCENDNEFLIWQDKVRQKLFEIIGMDMMEKCEPEPELLGSQKMDGYTRNKITIQVEPGVRMPFYQLIPDIYKDNMILPCMITTHGHSSGGKYSPAGRKDIPAIKDQIDGYNYDYGVRFAKKGYMVFCPDARAFGERREWMKQNDNEEDFLTSTCIPLNHIAISLGMSLTGMWSWDLMRLTDYIQTRADCDHERIGCAGLSGGGLQTLWLAAMDERIKCAVVSGYFYGYLDSLLKLSGNCGCNYVPGLWRYVDMGDLGALVAPRALLIETGSDDPLNGERGIINVIEQVGITKRAYAVAGAENNLYHHIFKGGHKWDGEKTYDFVADHLI